MTDKTPFKCTLLGSAAFCFGAWSILLQPIEYVATLAFMGFQFCCVAWLIMGLALLVRKVRQAFTFASYDLADFARGKTAGKSGAAHGPDGRFYNPKKAAMTAQLAAENAARKTKVSA